MKVSILSAVYNEEKHIAEMIRSVIGQSLSDFELLFCDDGSTDKTVQIIEGFAKLDNRIKLVHSGSKVGKAKAFNLAFDFSSGETLVLLGGDDIIPVDSIRIRYDSIPKSKLNDKIAAYFKLITFSEVSRFDNLIIPRGNRGNRSGGTVIMTRPLADSLFPIDERLATEDVWLSTLTKYLADEIIDSDKIVLKYRIHDGNSNPRHQSFNKANHSFHLRLLTYRYILENPHLGLNESSMYTISDLADLEDMRYTHNTIGIVISGKGDFRSKIFNIMHSNATLFNLRHKFFAFFSGR